MHESLVRPLLDFVGYQWLSTSWEEVWAFGGVQVIVVWSVWLEMISSVLLLWSTLTSIPNSCGSVLVLLVNVGHIYHCLLLPVYFFPICHSQYRGRGTIPWLVRVHLQVCGYGKHHLTKGFLLEKKFNFIPFIKLPFSRFLRFRFTHFLAFSI